MFKNKNLLSLKGFTLVELLVVIAMAGILITFAIAMFNPVFQINKAKDAQRKHDFEQIRNALDTYYNDYNCYPQSVPFGSQWSVGNTLYMKKVPQDPDCSVTGYCYIYQTNENSTCPQWNILWARFSNTTNALTSCLIRNACSTYPNLKYNYCVMSGQVDCAFVKTDTSAFGGSSGGGSPTPPTTPTPTTPVGINCNGQYYAQSPYTKTGCDNLGSDPLNKCSIHGGTEGYICYSKAGSGPGAACGGSLCAQ